MRLTLSKNLAPLRAEAVAKIDREAEELRSRFITPGAGQALVYQQKEAEAELVIANREIAHSLVPHIAREAQMNAVSLFDQAVIIRAKAKQWREISAEIELRRLTAKKAVAEAKTPAEIEAASRVDWSEIEERA